MGESTIKQAILEILVKDDPNFVDVGGVVRFSEIIDNLSNEDKLFLYNVCFARLEKGKDNVDPWVDSKLSEKSIEVLRIYNHVLKEIAEFKRGQSKRREDRIDKIRSERERSLEDNARACAKIGAIFGLVGGLSVIIAMYGRGEYDILSSPYLTFGILFGAPVAYGLFGYGLGTLEKIREMSILKKEIDILNQKSD